MIHSSKTLHILVVTSEIYSSGGMLRFERIARCLRAQGHNLNFCCMTGKVSPLWSGDSRILSPEDAANTTWDATLLPGRAGFDLTPDKLNSLILFQKPQFGLRVQFILNDTSYRAGFLLVNRTFAPRLVIFNNHTWTVDDFPDFLGSQFHFLEGGVEMAAFQHIPIPTLTPTRLCWIGGQARKNAHNLAGALRYLPPNFRMRLFGEPSSLQINAFQDLIKQGRLELTGPIEERALPTYYSGVDIVVTPELVAGWSNTAAEALAAGRPVICTTSGTKAFAKHGETSLIIEDTSPANIAQTIKNLHSDPSYASRLAANGRKAISKFDWTSYSNKLIELLKGPQNAHYFYAPEAGLYGKWRLDRRLAGLDTLLAACNGCSILDIGCAEGLIAEQCLLAGARQIDGVELDAERVLEAQRRNMKNADRVHFFAMDLNQPHALEQSSSLQSKYDIVLYLGVHHHLDPAAAPRVFRSLLSRARQKLYMRTSEILVTRDQLVEHARALGFTLNRAASSEEGDLIGALWEFTAETTPHNTQDAIFMTPQFISYPKSGRTWIRYILFQLGYEGQIQFHHDGFEFNNGNRPPHDFDLDMRRTKYAQSGPIVFLTRNPRAVMVSLYHQIIGRFKDIFYYEGTLSDFLHDPYFGAEVLARFRKMWMALTDNQNILVVSYEECHADLASAVESILQHFGLPINREAIAKAVANSTLENMRAIEEADTFTAPWLKKRNGHGKVRVGATQRYHDELSAADIEYLDTVFKLQDSFFTKTANNTPPPSISPIIVLGMHRCGTSATAGLLSTMGLSAGTHLFLGNEFNQKGYFEDSRIVKLHDELLIGLGSSWKDLRPLPEGWMNTPLTFAISEQLRILIRDTASQGRQWVIKDPRMCKLLPLWLQLLQELKLTPRFVLVIRSPEACAASLHARDGLPQNDAYALWLIHTKAAELSTRGFQRSFVHYESLLLSWRKELSRLETHLGLQLNWDSENINRATNFISPELNHAPSSPLEKTSKIARAAHALHEHLTKITPAYDPAGAVDDLFEEINSLIFEQAFTFSSKNHLAVGPASDSATAIETSKHGFFLTDRLTAQNGTLEGRSQPSTVALAETSLRTIDAIPTPHPEPKAPPPPTSATDYQQYELAASWIAAGDVEEGIKTLISLASDNTSTWEVYADLAEFAARQDDQQAALDLILKAANLAPQAKRAALGAAKLLGEHGEFESALATLSPYLRLQPNDAEALTLTRQLLGKAPELSAIAWARLLVDLRQDSSGMRPPFARQQDAMQKLRADVPITPAPSTPSTAATAASVISAQLSTTRSEQNDARGLPAMQTTAANQDSQKVKLARTLIAQELFAEAAEILTELVLAETPLFHAYYDLGSIAVRQGEVETAISLFSMALDRDPESAAARRNLALMQGLEGRYEEALAALSPVLRSDQAGSDDYGLVRDILGKSPALSPIAWARLLTDLRTPSSEQKKVFDDYDALRDKLAAQKSENDRLRTEITELRTELRYLAAPSNTEARNAAWQVIHTLPDDEWLNVLLRSVQMPSYRGFPLPGFPSEGLQTGTVGSSNEFALREGFNFYRTVKALCASHGHALTSDTRLLDFGTGWGRYSRIFMKEITPDNITGVDVDPSLIQVCRDTFPYCNFEVVPPFPPTDLPAGHFDLVVAYSVFSHLAEAAATAWIEEFARILAPGGMIAVTTQGRRFLDYCEQIRRSGEITHPWHRNLAESFVDLDAAQAAYDRGEFLYSATGGGDARPSSFYGEALVPPGFVENIWSRFLEPIAYIDDGSLPQALIVMRKPH